MTVFLRSSRWIVAALGAAMFLGASRLLASPAYALPALIPQPRTMAATPGCALAISRAHPLTVSSRVDPGGLDLLRDRLTTLHLPAPATSSVPIVRVARVAAPSERYSLDVTRNRITIGASSAAAEFDALATLAQLVGQGSTLATVPCVRIQDQPALAWRFLSDDVSRGPLPTMGYLASRIRRLASYKYNGYSLYLENVVIRRGHEQETRADGFTTAELRQLAQLCARYHMIFIPEQESLGHLDSLLSLPQYSDLREAPLSDVISPAVPRTYDVLREIFYDEFSGIPNIPLIHIGADETIRLGDGRSAELVKRLGYATVFSQHVSKVANIVRQLGARPIIWGDQTRLFPQILQLLPKSIIIMPFNYDVLPSFDPLIIPIKRAGFTQLVSPSVANVAQFFPNIPMATGNIGGFVAAAKRQGLRGMFVTTWIGARDELYDATWYPAAFAAAHAWEKVNEPPGPFCERFAQVTFGTRMACAPFRTFARLADDFQARFPFDKPPAETLWRADWRVRHFAERVQLAPAASNEFQTAVESLQRQIDALPQKRDEHHVNAMRLAALRYAVLLALLRHETPSPELVRRTEQLHLSEWRYENRRLSATDQITKPYESWLPEAQLGASKFMPPEIKSAAAANESQATEALIAAREPLSDDNTFLFQDPVQYIASAKGIDRQTAAALFQKADAFQTKYGGADIQTTARYFYAQIQRGSLPTIIRGRYNHLLSLPKTTRADTVKRDVDEIILSLFFYEGRLSDLASSYRNLPSAEPSVLNALDQQGRRVEKMVTCFQTLVHEWTTYGGGPEYQGSTSVADEPAAHLPTNIRAAFCEP